MLILRRYIIREMVTPTLLGFGFYTFIILMRNLFDLAEMIIKRSLPIGTVFKLLALSLPHIVVLTIPMSLLFGILIAIGRLSSDSEIVAMRATGLSMGTIYRPVLYFSLAVFAINLYLMNVVLPRGNTALVGLRNEIFASSVEQELQPRVFYDEYENLVIYVDDVDETTGAWKGVFVSDTTDPMSQRIVIAQTGSLSQSADGRQLWLDLQNAKTHGYSHARPDRYDFSSNATLRFLLNDRFADAQTSSTDKDYRSMTLQELIRERNRARGEARRIADVEIHKKFAIPFACLSFGILGLPLGITNRRGGKSSGFTLSIGIILFYYVVISNGEDLARTGTIHPALAMWLPNILLIGLGIWLMRRANVDTSAPTSPRHWYQKVARKVGAWIRSRRKKAASSGEGPMILSRLDIAFPNILDRYILKQFAGVLGLVLLSTIVLFVVIDYSELAGQIAPGVDFGLIASYYRYYIIQVLNLVIPISVLLGTLITFGILSKNNEVTALKSNGVSLYRVTLPIIIVAALVSGLSYLIQDFVLPYSNKRVVELKAKVKGRVTPRAFSIQQRQWIFGKGRYLFNFLSYQPQARTLGQVQVLELRSDRFDLEKRIFADEARYDGIGWVFVNGWIRSFNEDGTVAYAQIAEPARMRYPETPDYFAQDVKPPQQMTYAQLRRYIQQLRGSGYAADELMVELYRKTSWPLVSLVMALIALPFSFRIGKRGALYGVGIALFLAFAYWTLFGVFTKFGEVGNLPAILSAWSANVLFSIAALYLFLRVET